MVLKSDQKTAIEELCKGKDVVLTLPTGMTMIPATM